MKILLITNDYPPIISGISTVFFHIWKFLTPNENLILVPSVVNDESIDSKIPINTIRYPFQNKKINLIKLVNLLMMYVHALVLTIRYKVKGIHAGQILSSGVVGLILKKLLGTSYFLWVYGGETTKAYTKSKLIFALMKLIISQADKIVTNSPFVTEEFAKFGIPNKKIVEILPAVDSMKFKPDPRPIELEKKYNLADRLILLTVSRLTRRKGHDLVLHCLKTLIEYYPNLIYIIVGLGEDADRLKRLVRKLDLSRYVIFAGYVRDSDLPLYYNLCDIFVMPNRETLDTTDSIEGFGISFIEASACAKPVIGGQSGGTAAAVVNEETGFLIDSTSVEDLRSKITKLIEQPDLRLKMGRKGRKRVKREFIWEKRAKKLAKIHEDRFDKKRKKVIPTI